GGTMRAGTRRRSRLVSPEVGARPPDVSAGGGGRSGSSTVSTASTASSALGEGVADSPHGQDERGRSGVVLDLLAQVADVDVDRLLILVERLVVAEELEQLGPRVDPAGSAGEMAE